MTLDTQLRIMDLCTIFKVNRSTIYRWVKHGYLPKPRMYGLRSPRWAKNEIEIFMEKQNAKEAA